MSARIASAAAVASRSAARDPDRELVAAEAPGEAVAPEHARDLAEHEVADAVPVAVVDALEVVDVADEHATRRAGAQ
jgi:hypothetical protein